MNSIAEATKSTINTIKIRALLSKALSSDPKPTPGYLFPEIASGSSSSNSGNNTYANNNNNNHNSSNTSAGTALSSTYDDSVHVILKALKILRQLAQSGSVEIRMQMARLAKQPLANLVGFRGEWDPIHGDQWNHSVRQAAEDLVEYLHAHPVQEHELVAAATMTRKERLVEEEGEVAGMQKVVSNEFDDDDDEDAGEFLSVRESELLKSSTQGLPGFGNPEFEESSSDDEGDRVGQRQRRGQRHGKSSGRSGQRRRLPREQRTPPPEPPLPGFGSDSLQGSHGTRSNAGHPPSLMDRLVDRLQELAAPAPPTAMALNAAKRQQERRRQKLFVGEYSMADEQPPISTRGGGGEGEERFGSESLLAPLSPSSTTAPISTSSMASSSLKAAPATGPVSIMGTNPFRRFPRQPGLILGGWAEPGEGVSQTQKWNRTLRAGAGVRRVEETSRHPVSLQVYSLAQNVQTGFVRTSPGVLSAHHNDSSNIIENNNDDKSKMKPVPGLEQETQPELSEDDDDDNSDLESDFVLWGTAKTVCDIVLEAIKVEQSSGEQGATGSQALAMPSVPVVTGLLRDLNDWIEHEDWDRRLKYLYLLDTLLAHHQIRKEILICPSISMLMTTLDGPKCVGASQRSVSRFSAYLSRYLKLQESHYRQYQQAFSSPQNAHDLLVDV
ncbi:hypothetical protein DFQ26_009071 [Actinomortierella ambigua]|nr:hypothetical protein DFQ26_009071 [Actinomortierella ambigua]